MSAVKRKASNHDEYRVTLFKKKLREIIAAPWLRFHYSKGRCHLYIETRCFREEDIPKVMARLKREGIEFKVSDWSFLGPGSNEIRGISIPIDQEALPERARCS